MRAFVMLLGLGLLLLTGAIMALAARPHADFYVAPNGNDSWSGRLAAPNSHRNDGPFLTLERAQMAVRTFRSQHPNLHRPIVVLIRGGFYPLKQPMVFTPEDSGTAESPTVFEAYPGEKPIISGGQVLNNWQAVAPDRWTTTLPDVKNGLWNFCQLWVNGERRYRPRLPINGYYTITQEGTSSPAAQGKGFDQFGYAPGSFNPHWPDLKDVEVIVFHTWAAGRYHVASLDTSRSIVTLVGHTPGTEWWTSFPKGNRYLIENVKEALSQPGQWYLDRSTGVLTYLPKAQERLQNAQIVAPRLDQLLLLQGNPNADVPVSYLVFRGLTFAYSNWNLPPEGHDAPQAEVDLPAAIEATMAHNCLFDRCHIMHTGAWAISLGEGCQNNHIENCAFTDLGAGGIKLGETIIREQPQLIASNNTVQNCLIADGGRLHPAATGIWIGQSPYNRLINNTIGNLYYTGISVGWTWGYGKSLAHDNIIMNNRIENIGQGLLSDMGGIYLLGISPGTVLEHNLLRHIRSLTYGGWGIYFDEGTSDVLAEDNIVYDTKSGGLHQHYGANNRVINNIFALNLEAQLVRTRAEDHLSFTLEHNIVYYRQGTLLGSNWSGNNYHLDYNLYWNAAGQPVTFDGMSFSQWQQKGQDLHSLIADPEFLDPEKGDFRLKSNSPAFRIGFKPISLTGFGCNLDPREVEAALHTPPAFPLPQIDVGQRP
ncbi:Right handed beta helix region [Chthonomonas calidirosea]|uniref:right-handed parallel beta-helix repeat-containing protein n=1 Tax=Chthonomonas calidirosea TaxID=454171 RepID=UPI0006DD49BB|nr:right-handed parallel beta-helix repeat-containing protein [Chthonomonas calidirosea]CEK15011.1 Right handed beta helix region [Chthonomonas calidirosea]